MGPVDPSAVSSVTARSAYRRSPGSASAPPEDESAAFGEQLHPALFVVWLASVACVVGAFYRHEVFGAEPTLALMMLVAIPWYAIAALARRKRR
jgi:hypothetical protein